MAVQYAVVTNYTTTLSAPMTSTQLTVPVNSVTTKDGHVLTMADLGAEAYLTLEPGTNAEEIVKIIGISGLNYTVDPAGRGMLYYGAADSAQAANRKAHVAGAVVIMSNVKNVYERLVDKEGDESIGGTKTFTENVNVPLVPVDPTHATSKDYVDDIVTSGTISDLRVTQDAATTYAVNSGKLIRGSNYLSYAGSTGNAVTLGSTNYVMLNQDGTLLRNITGFITGKLPLATITTSGIAITGVTDNRAFFTQPDGLIPTEVTVTYGGTITAGQPVYLNTATNRVERTSAAAAGTSLFFIGFALDSGVNGDTNKRVQIGGEVTGLAGLTAGNYVYLQDAAGTISTAGAGSYSRPVGFATTATSLWMFNMMDLPSIAGLTPAVTTTLINTVAAYFTAPYTQDQRTTFTAGQDLAAGNVVSVTSSGIVNRSNPTSATVTGMEKSATQATTLTSSSGSAFLASLSTSLKAFVYIDTNAGSLVPQLIRIPITPSDGTVGTIENTQIVAGTAAAGMNTIDCAPASAVKLIVTGAATDNFRAQVADLTSGVATLGGEVTIDAADSSEGYVEYISDSHVLFFHRNTALGNLEFKKYTLSGVTLTSSSSGTVTTPAFNYSLEGVKRFLGTNFFLFVVQDTTNSVGKVMIAEYDTGTSTFTTVGSFVSFAGGVDILGGSQHCEFAKFSGTKMGIGYPITSTTGAIAVVTRSGTTATIGTPVSMAARGANAGYTTTMLSAAGVAVGTMSGTTATYRVYELDRDQTTFTQQISTTTTTAPSSGTLESGSVVALFPVTPIRMGAIGFIGASDDPSVGTNQWTTHTFYGAVGIVLTNANSAANVNVITSGFTNTLVDLTPGSRYFADVGGALSADGNSDIEHNVRVLVSKEATQGIISL